MTLLVVAFICCSLALLGEGKKVSSSSLLPSCNGCFSEVNGVAYACCSDMTINNGYCTCNNGPCTQCSPTLSDKKKPVGAPPVSALPSCGGCYSGVNGISFTCPDCIISINNGQCVCGDGSACMQCNPSFADKEVKPVPVPPAMLPSCGGCYAGVNGVEYACCNGMTINNGACSCFGGTPCTQCAPSPKDKAKTVPVKSRCSKCFSAFEGTFFDCCPNQTFVHGECFCGGDGKTSCTKCELSAEEHKVTGIIGSDFCWNPSCGMFSGTCCSQGKQCCYDNSQSNPCTADCGCVCGGSWSCPANSYRVPYFNLASLNGTCNRAMGATSDYGCLYDSGSCQPWCLCNPGYRSTEGCLINGQAPVLASGQCIPMNEHDKVESPSQKPQHVGATNPRPFGAGVGPCDALLSGGNLANTMGICVQGSDVTALSWYDSQSGSLTPICNITVANTQGPAYIAQRAVWSGGGWFNQKQLQVCFCEDPNCNGGAQLCSDSMGSGGSWNVFLIIGVAFSGCPARVFYGACPLIFGYF